VLCYCKTEYVTPSITSAGLGEFLKDSAKVPVQNVDVFIAAIKSQWVKYIQGFCHGYHVRHCANTSSICMALFIA
jgi:hypothetical protein